VKVFVADRDLASAEAYVKEINGNEKEKAAAAEVNVSDWEQQVRAFDAAIAAFGRIDYVYPIAGIGEKRWLPSTVEPSGWEKPDLSVSTE
jgi:NAD(P)-dependent dehydrogenase (short-subunit alcohol dehydrogenase family)